MLWDSITQLRNKFICRSSVLLSVNIDKTTEKDLLLVVEASSKLLADEELEVIEFTSHVDLSKEPGNCNILGN